MSETEQEAIRLHVEACSVCALILDSVLHPVPNLTLSQGERVTGGRGRALFFDMRKWAAAAVVLFAAGIVPFLWSSHTTDPKIESGRGTIPLEYGRTYRPDTPITLKTGPGAVFTLSQEAFLKVGGEKRGDRTPLTLEKGELQASISHPASRVEIDVPGGRIRDIGTEFSVRVWETKLPWHSQSRRTVRITAVETRAGIVEIEGAGTGPRRSVPGRKGYLLENGELFLKDEPVHIRSPGLEDWTQSFQSLKEALRRQDESGALRIWGSLLERGKRSGTPSLDTMLKEAKMSPEEQEWFRQILQTIEENYGGGAFQ